MDHPQGYTDIVIDLETLDTRDSAIVLSLGAVAFNMWDHTLEYKEFYEVCGTKELREEQQMMGRTKSAGAVTFWKKQSKAAKHIFNESTVSTVHELLEKFTSYYQDCKSTTDVHVNIWGNGAEFDNAILKNLYECYAEEAPWPFHASRCFRTMKNVLSSVGQADHFKGTKHHALDDARNEADHLKNILNGLRSRQIIF